MTWVSVEDQLPPEGKEVLTYDDDKQYLVQAYEYSLPEDGTVRHYFSTNSGWVRYWMSISDPPLNQVDSYKRMKEISKESWGVKS